MYRLVPKRRKVASMMLLLRRLREDLYTEPVSLMSLLSSFKKKKKGSTECALNKHGRVKATFSKGNL